MLTHVDTAAAVRIVGTDHFAMACHQGPLEWGRMCVDTIFLEEDDEEGILDLISRAPSPAERVRVSRVVDVLVF